MKGWLKQLFSEDNGDDVCLAKVMAVVAFVSFLGYAGWGVYKGDFHLDAYANGLMQVLLGSAGVIAGKNITTRSS